MPTPQISTFDQLREFINTNFPDNNSGLVDPEDVRVALRSFVDIQSLRNDMMTANLSPQQAAVWQLLINKLDQIQRDSLSGVKGVAKQSNAPTPYVSGYLFEVWKVSEPITAPNSWGNKTVSQAELDENFVFFNVTNGVVSKELSKKPEGVNVSQEFDISNSDMPASMKATAQWLGVGKFAKLIGSNLVGGLTSSASGASTGQLMSNLSCKAAETMTIKSVVTNFTVVGNFKLAITNANNAVIWTSAETYTAGTGWVTNNIPDKVLEAGQTIWLSMLSSSAFNIRYGESGAPNTEKFIQRPLNGVIASGPAGSYYSLYFKGENDFGTGILSNYLSKSEAAGYTNIDPLETFGSSAFSNAIGNHPVTALYILKIPYTVAKTVQKLSFTSAAAGSMKFVIGTLDQANKFIQDREISLNVVAGLNNITVDWELKIGQYVGVKTPGLMPNINTSIANNYLWAVEGSYTAPLVAGGSWSLGLALDVRTRVYSPDALAHMTDIYALQTKIDNIQVPNIYTSPDGNKWRLSVSNAGTSVWTIIGKYTKILHFGNSILKHGIVAYWWGFWGMAAKTRQDDYAHRFLAKIKVASPTAQSWEENIATWEQNPAGFNKSTLDTLLTAQAYDLVVVRLGENATGVPAATYKTEFRNLITYIQTKVPTARIIIGGMFWANGALDAAMMDIATEKGLTYASMSGLDIPANKSFIGDVVQGDDGQSHTVNNAGVANHPNNVGMEAIATRLFNAANS